MKPSVAKEHVLKKIRAALITRTPNPFPNTDFEKNIYSESKDTNDILFAKEFSKVNGQFIYCSDTYDFANNFRSLAEEKQWKNIHCFNKELLELFKHMQVTGITESQDLSNAEVGVTNCESLIARTGSLLISSADSNGRQLSILPPVHVVIASTDQLAYDLKEAFDLVKRKYKGTYPSMLSVTTGPSRTADIEKTLVLGAHGPKDLFVFLIEK
jgi:L-lactate dehydrogenase complex protein LldG